LLKAKNRLSKSLKKIQKKAAKTAPFSTTASPKNAIKHASLYAALVNMETVLAL
jgi:hypothetical protein